MDDYYIRPNISYDIPLEDKLLLSQDDVDSDTYSEFDYFNAGLIDNLRTKLNEELAYITTEYMRKVATPTDWDMIHEMESCESNCHLEHRDDGIYLIKMMEMDNETVTDYEDYGDEPDFTITDEEFYDYDDASDHARKKRQVSTNMMGFGVMARMLRGAARFGGRGGRMNRLANAASIVARGGRYTRMRGGVVNVRSMPRVIGPLSSKASYVGSVAGQTSSRVGAMSSMTKAVNWLKFQGLIPAKISRWIKKTISALWNGGVSAVGFWAISKAITELSMDGDYDGLEELIEMVEKFGAENNGYENFNISSPYLNDPYYDYYTPPISTMNNHNNGRNNAKSQDDIQFERQVANLNHQWQNRPMSELEVRLSEDFWQNNMWNPRTYEFCLESQKYRHTPLPCQEILSRNIMQVEKIPFKDISLCDFLDGDDKSICRNSNLGTNFAS
jgi:hypothetical protein